MDEPEDIPIVEQSVIGGWGVGPKIREKVTLKLQVHLQSADPEISIKAARALERIDRRQQEALIALRDQGGGDDEAWASKYLPELIENGVSVTDALAEAEAAGHPDAGPLCADSEPGGVATDPTSAAAESGHHGHAAGEGQHSPTAGDDAPANGQE